MTCQERVDLMQRYLDHDLNEAEERELLLHLQQCEECAGLFDRLLLLDEELSQLPKVTPAFSLVDAILPQLAELDRFPASLEETAAREPTATVPFGGIPRTRRPLISWKLAGGAAVAAALIGIFVLKEQNLFTPLNMNSSASTASAGAKAAADMKSSNSAPAAADAASSLKKDAGSSGGASNEVKAPLSGTATVQDQAEAPGPSTDKAAASPKENISQYAPSMEPKAAGHSQNPEENRVAISSQPEANGNGTGDNKLAPTPSSTPKNDSPAVNPSEPVTSGPAETSTPVPDAGEAGPSSTSKGKAGTASPKSLGPQTGGIMSLGAPTPDPAPVTMKSPDSKLIAAIEELRVIVRNADTGATVRSSTYSWSAVDAISFISFSEDGKLAYRVQHRTDVEDLLLDVATGVETRSSAGEARK